MTRSGQRKLIFCIDLVCVKSRMVVVIVEETKAEDAQEAEHSKTCAHDIMTAECVQREDEKRAFTSVPSGRLSAGCLC
jgi:hypothetical protein